MNGFLKSIEAQRLKEHEERILTLRGDELPKQPRTKRGEAPERGDSEYTRRLAERRRVVGEMTRRGMSQTSIAKQLGITVRQVITAQRPRGKA